MQKESLQRGEEPILAPEIEITDPHHHLAGVGSFGGKMHRPHSLGSDYTLDEFLKDTRSGHRVTNTVFVEAAAWFVTNEASPQARPSEASPEEPCAPLLAGIGEATAVAQVARETQLRGGAVVRGMVGWVDFRYGSACGEAIDRMSDVTDGLLVGIRASVAWDPSPDVRSVREQPGPDLLLRPNFQAGVAELARRDLTLDVFCFHTQLPDLGVLADTFPSLRIVLNHLGGPLGVGPYKADRTRVLADWRANMAQLARRPNIMVKLGGVGYPQMAKKVDVTGDPNIEPTSRQLADYWGAEVRWCVENFGADRCMFESNFPVDGQMCSYVVIWNAFKRMVADASTDEKRELFAGTANRVYRLTSRRAGK